MVVRIEKRKKKMQNEVTAYGILKALKESGDFNSAKMLAVLANIDTTSANLQKIKDDCFYYVEQGFVTVKVLKDPKAPWRKRPLFKVVV
tara:strand:- start:304 stop:570 length:267 start_codon:yes stop_codon:yes gene_type:complete